MNKAEDNTERYWAPTRIIRRYPEAPDNKGRVSDGTARHMRNQAEAHHNGSQHEAIGKLVSMADRVDETNQQRNARKRQRRARRQP